MVSLDLCILTLPIEEKFEHVVIDRYGDTLLTLSNPRVNGESIQCAFEFQVSSEVLQLVSWYFRGAFNHSFLETQLGLDGKYHFSYTDLDAEALYVLLLTVHKEFLCRFDDDYYLTCIGVPTTVSLDILVGTAFAR